MNEDSSNSQVIYEIEISIFSNSYFDLDPIDPKVITKGQILPYD
jgi:hypothetical protein